MNFPLKRLSSIALLLLSLWLYACWEELQTRGLGNKSGFAAGFTEQKAPVTESCAFWQIQPTASMSTRTPTPAGLKPSPTAATATVESVTPNSSKTSSPKRTERPTITPSAPVCLKDGGILRSGEIVTDLLRETLQYHIYMPPCYEQQPDQHYPVLYLFHGLHLPVTQWERIGVDEAADRLIASGKIPPLIIVMPYDPYSSRPDANKFGEAIVEELVPHIDRMYRTIPDRTHRAIGGLSRGGAWAIHLGLTYLQDFGAIGGHSPAIFFNNYSVLKNLVHEIPPELYPRIYLDIGDRDDRTLISDLITFENRLDELSIPHEWHFFQGYHNEAYWRAHVDQYLLWYSEGW